MFLFRMMGKLISSLGGVSSNDGVAIMIVAIFFSLALLVLNLSQYKSLKIAQAVEPLMRDIERKYKNDSNKRTEELMKMLAANGYNLFSSFLIYILQIIVVIGLIGALAHPELYIHAGQPELTSFLWVPDLTKSCLDYVRAGEFSADFLFSLLLPAIAVFLTVLHNRKVQELRPIDQNLVDNIMLVAMIAVCLIFAQGIALYWCVIYLFNLLLLHLVLKFYTVKLKKQPGKKASHSKK